MEFILKITLGNEAMLTREEVGAALEMVGRTLSHYPGEVYPMSYPYLIRDTNGNKIGTWQFVEQVNEEVQE